MGFQDLPLDWQDRSVADPQLTADIVDLFVTEEGRREGTLYLLFCDGQNRVRAPMAIGNIGAKRPEEFGLLLRPLFELVRQTRPEAGLLMALARTGLPDVTPVDRAWADAARRLCEQVAMPLLGFYIAVPERVVDAMG
ncbi:hypothetical protein [Kribbella deserti]|uniref:YbjN domain-containing protein n=1 Tax=Kribbella deserti TaxID=1926257 RepID=A0ABV6QIQ3_9ACTN